MKRLIDLHFPEKEIKIMNGKEKIVILVIKERSLFTKIWAIATITCTFSREMGTVTPLMRMQID